MADNENENFINNDMADNNVIKQSKSETEEDNDKKSRIIREIRSWACTIGGAVVLAFIITTFIIVNAVVPSESMENTINVGDRLVAFRLSYIFSDPERYDIVVFKYPDDEDTLFIKRIIGLPGETVSIRKNDNDETKVYINDSEVPLDDSFIKEPMKLVSKNGPNRELTYKIPADCYFMLGDNRNNSKDSRFWENTFVQKDKILGKALFKYYPSIEWIDSGMDG